MKKLIETLLEYGVEITVSPVTDSEDIEIVFTKYPRRSTFILEKAVFNETNTELIVAVTLHNLEAFVKQSKEVAE